MKGSKQLIVALAILFLIVTVLIEYRSFEAQKMELKAVLDRIEGDQAVLLLENWNKEIILPVEQLPKGSEEKMWFRIEKKENDYYIKDIDEKTLSTWKKL